MVARRQGGNTSCSHLFALCSVLRPTTAAYQKTKELNASCGCFPSLPAMRRHLLGAESHSSKLWPRAILFCCQVRLLFLFFFEMRCAKKHMSIFAFPRVKAICSYRFFSAMRPRLLCAE